MIISFASFKGGTGKTTCCANLAYYAGVKKKKKTLVIDLDSQGGLSHNLSSKCDSEKPTFYDAIENLIPFQNVIKEYSKNLHFLTADERSYKIFTNGNLEKSLAKLEDAYDLIFIDLCPSRFEGSEKPLLISDYICIPLDASCPLSIIGAERFAKVLLELQNKSVVELMGVIPNKVDRTNLSKECIEYMKENYKDDVMPSIRKSADIPRSCALGKTIFEHRSTSQAAKDFDKLGREFMRRLI